MGAEVWLVQQPWVTGLHQGAQAVRVVEWSGGLGGSRGGALLRTSGGEGALSDLHLVEVRLQTHPLRLLLEVHPLLVQSVFLQLLL